jgi:K+/H+ antiporter YhaU regulatory subunit KhtT
MKKPNLSEYEQALAASVSGNNGDLANLMNVASLTAVGVVQASKDRQALLLALGTPEAAAVEAIEAELADLAEQLTKAEASVERTAAKAEKVDQQLHEAKERRAAITIAKRDGEQALKNNTVATVAATFKAL